jgi:hypothetical protein
LQTFADLIYVLALCFLVAHELDAIDQHEWRFFFRFLDDRAGYRLFTTLHVPLLAIILWNIQSRPFQIGMDVFLIVHLGLHILLRNHRLIEFKSWYSWVWIVGAAVLGAVHLVTM